MYGTGDEKVGEIDHLMIDKLSGRVIYAVMSFGGKPLPDTGLFETRSSQIDSAS